MKSACKELLNDKVITEINVSSQVFLRWNLQKDVVVILGSSNPSYIKEDTEIYHFELTDAEINKINVLDRNEKHDVLITTYNLSIRSMF